MHVTVDLHTGEVMALVDAMIETLTEELFTALMNQAQYALDFKSQFERTKTQLELVKAFLNDTETLKTKKEVLKLTMIQIRELIYEADDLLTDCRIRDEYQKDGRCSNFSASKLLFQHSFVPIKGRDKQSKQAAVISKVPIL